MFKRQIWIADAFDKILFFCHSRENETVAAEGENVKLTEAIIDKYITYCEKAKNLDWKTLKAYRTDLCQFAGYLTGKAAAFRWKTVVDCIAHLNGTCKPRTVKRKRASIRALTTWLLDEGLLARNPFENLRLQAREPSQLPRVIPFWVVVQMLKAAHSEMTLHPGSERALCETAVLELLFATGIRVSSFVGSRRAIKSCSVS